METIKSTPEESTSVTVKELLSPQTNKIVLRNIKEPSAADSMHARAVEMLHYIYIYIVYQRSLLAEVD